MRSTEQFSQSLNRPLAGAVAAALIIAFMLFESVVPPWAPFFYAGAALTLVTAILARPTLQARALRISDLGVAALALVVLAAIEISLGPGMDALAAALGRAGHPMVPLNAALQALLAKASLEQQISLDTATAIYAVFYLVWAPVAEELFYRGYLLRAFDAFTPRSAAVLSSVFFALTHMTHLFYLETTDTATASLLWGVGTFVAGLGLCWLVRRTGSLWIAMGVHFAVNVIGIAAG